MAKSGCPKVRQAYFLTQTLIMVGSNIDLFMIIHILLLQVDDNFCGYPACLDTAINFICLDGRYFTGSQVPRGTNYVKFDYVYSEGRDEVIARFAFVGIDKEGNKINITDGRLHYKTR
jgi:hypothetical protein